MLNLAEETVRLIGDTSGKEEFVGLTRGCTIAKG